MSPRQPRVTAAELLRALQRDGWTIERQSDSHALLTHPEKSGRVIVPRHAGKIVKLGTLASILRDTDLSVDQLRGLL